MRRNTSGGLGHTDFVAIISLVFFAVLLVRLGFLSPLLVRVPA